MTTLQNFYTKSLQCSFDAIAADEELALSIQARLTELGLLEQPTKDQPFGEAERNALKVFQERLDITEDNFIGRNTAGALLVAKREELEPKATAETQKQTPEAIAVPVAEKPTEQKSKSKSTVEAPPTST